MIKKIKILIVIVFLSLILFTTSSYGAIEIKEERPDAFTISPSNAFATCYNLRANSTTLGNNSLDPHLVLNSDWATVIYLTLSVYGTNNQSRYQYSTGNKSGVFYDDCYFIPSALLETAITGPSYENIYKYRNTKYVESLPIDDKDLVNKGRGIYELSAFGYKNLGSKFYPINKQTPLMGRNNLIRYWFSFEY